MPVDQLTLRERAVLLVLMAEGRELTNRELHELAGLRLDGEPRKRLNALGLVNSAWNGRAYVHELTDSGAVWCSAELHGSRPVRSGYAGGALYAVLAGLRRYLDDTGLALADVFQANVESQVESAYAELTDGRGGTVRLAVLRDRLAGVPRNDVDRALRALSRREGVHMRAEADQKTLTERDREAAVVWGGTARHLLVMEAAP
ncbi:hypothetical protein F0L68_15060 [Solihabitans fulvus]|uniref:Uncharacterized protein n=1 Tax=Solihabitans fulvus TaxID=1892852 RepID=A0A5B2XFJ1_9PSEU|nr:hypothetical protein [Solihabitans fulvus]KAA2261839.1 hypothetical protein F0L68_15060 [Solihabitans fulvus]